MWLRQQLSEPPGRSPQPASLPPPLLALHWPHCASQQMEPSVLGMPLAQFGSGAGLGAGVGGGVEGGHEYVIR